MTIYSGFLTRSQQQQYDQLIQDLIFVLQKRLIKFYNQQSTDQEKFLYVLAQLYHQMTTLEKTKYLQPKTSNSIQAIIYYLYTNIDQVQHQQTNHNRIDNYTVITPPTSNNEKYQQKIKQNGKFCIQYANEQQKIKLIKEQLLKLNYFNPTGKILSKYNFHQHLSNSLIKHQFSLEQQPEQNLQLNQKRAFIMTYLQKNNNNCICDARELSPNEKLRTKHSSR